MSTFTNYRNTTPLNENRTRAILAASFVVVLAFTIGITAIAISMGGKNKSLGNNIPAPVSSAIVFANPVAQYTSILKGCSLTELQYNETMRRWEAHKMVTIEAPLGAPVNATFEGTVTKVQDHLMYGRMVTIDHGRDGLVTVLSNLAQDTLVREGDRVTKGMRIGAVGQTSKIEFTKTPHLRIEVYKNGKRVDPNDYIDFPIK